MGKRFAIVIGAAAAGVMALGAQTAAAEVVKYDTELTLTKEGQPRGLYHGHVMSDRDRNPEYHPAKGVRKCMVGRRVVLFKLRPGADHRLGTDLSVWGPGSQILHPAALPLGVWEVRTGGRDYGDRVRAVVKRKVRDRYVCRADRAVYDP